MSENIKPEIIFFLLAFIGCFFFSFASAIYVNFIGYKLHKYLMKNNYERWKEITSVGKVWTSLRTIKTHKYIYSQLDDEDNNILKFKNKLRKSLKFFLLNFIACFVFLIVLYLYT